MKDMEEIIFEIITYSGSAKALVYEAIGESEKGDFDKAFEYLKEADDTLIKAHEIQTTLIQAEANEEKIPISVLFVHAQDHLMSAIEVRTLSENLIKINKRLKEMEN